jgi:hypothetical protein
MGHFLLTDYIGMSFLFYRVLDQINCVSPHLWEFSQNLGIGIGRVYHVEVSERGGVEDRPSISAARCLCAHLIILYPPPRFTTSREFTLIERDKTSWFSDSMISLRPQLLRCHHRR